MTRYIELDALVAEIEKRIKVLQNNPYENHKTICHLDSLKQSFNTLEMKKVDLEKEIKDYFNNQPIVARSKGVDYQLIPSGESIAKHFFTLGVKQSVCAANPLTVKDIKNIYHLVNEVSDDLGVRAMYVNIYQETLKRFKAQKGE